MTGVLAILVSLFLLMFFAYRGVTVLLLAPLMAGLAIVLSGEAALLLPLYTNTFMPALAGYVLNFLPIFLLGALFGRLVADSGAAYTLSNWIVQVVGKRHAVPVIVLACALLTYGGVSLFVVAFAVYPIAQDLFRRAGLPKRLIPASIALGSFSFTMTALPGTPSIQNAIPIPYFGTNSFAAPGLGLIASAIMLACGLWWLHLRVRAAHRAGEGYGEHDAAEKEESQSNDTDKTSATGMPVMLALLPLVLVIGINALLTFLVFPRVDWTYMEQAFPDLAPGEKTGLWALIIALALACLTLVLLRLRNWENLKATVNKGIFGFMLPLFNTASEVGYGAVIASMSGFFLIRNAVLDIAPGNPLISEAVAISTLAGITGSSSGGLAIGLEALGADYLTMAQAAGISPELLHRVAVMAAGGMDTLPHCGAIITLLAICRLTHRQSYIDIGAVTIVGPLLALVAVIALGTVFGSF